MAELTKLEEKLAEVTGLASAAQTATGKVKTLTEEDVDLPRPGRRGARRLRVPDDAEAA